MSDRDYRQLRRIGVAGGLQPLSFCLGKSTRRERARNLLHVARVIKVVRHHEPLIL